MIKFYYLVMVLITGDVTDYNFQKRNTRRVFYSPSLLDICLFFTTGVVVAGIKYGNNEI